MKDKAKKKVIDKSPVAFIVIDDSLIIDITGHIFSPLT